MAMDRRRSWGAALGPRGPRPVRGPAFTLVALWLLLVASGRMVAGVEGVGPSKSRSGAGRRRLLASDFVVVRECDWAAADGSGSGKCLLGSDYASRTLASADSDAAAQYISSALACARVTSADACNAEGAGCAWDASFADGQQGCFISEARALAAQRLCAAPRYSRALDALEACAAARRTCQCASTAACAAVTAASGACQSLLGCWLARLAGSPNDMLGLTSAQLLRVGPLLASLTPNATATGLTTAAAAASAGGSGQRRHLLQPAGLNSPVSDDTVRKKAAAAAAAASSTPVKVASVTQDAGGQNQPILSDAAALRGGGSSSSSGGASGGLGNLESAAVIDAGIIQPEATVPTLANGQQQQQVAAADDTDVMAYAPPSFWKCLADAAVVADTATNWANVDYNSKKVSLDTWLSVIRKLAALDWGARALECYKAQAAAGTGDRSVGAAPDGQSLESYELAITQLISAFSGMRTQFQRYMQAAAADKPGEATKGFAALLADDGPLAGGIAELASKYNSTAAYSGDSLLQARALLADARWFVAEASAIADASGAPGPAYEAVMAYSVEQMRYLLRWLFGAQFGGPPVSAPKPPATTPAGIAASQALSTLAAAALPPAGVPLSEPRWLQARAMATHALLAGALEAAALPTGAASNATLAAGSAAAALGLAHVADFWGARVNAARAGADAGMRALALDDRTASNGAPTPASRDAALGLYGALAGLRLQVAALNGDDSAAASAPGAGAPADRVRDGLARLLGAVAVQSNPDLPAGAGADGMAAAVSRASSLAAAVLACNGAGSASTTTAAARTKACNDLDAASAALVKAALGDLAGGDGDGSSDPLYAAAAAGVALQWRCAARAPGSCAAAPGCARALLPAPPTPGPYPIIAPLPLPGEVAACQADDARLSLRGADNATKAALAADAGCAAFLQLPACEALSGAAACAKYDACRWQASASRALFDAPSAPTNSAGAVCATRWPAVLSTARAAKQRSLLVSAAAECGAQQAAGGCSALTAQVEVIPTLGARRGGAPSPAVIGGAVGGAAAGALVIAAFAIYAARRRAAAAADADAADGAASGSAGAAASGSGGRKGKGKAGKAPLRRKAKRAEPGEYKPDLMRDSFTDYMGRGPAFRAGVAIASANLAAGEGGLAADLAAAGGSGERFERAHQGNGAGGLLIDLGSGGVDDDGLESRRGGAGGSGSSGAAAPAAAPAAAAAAPESEGGVLQQRPSLNPFRPVHSYAASDAGMSDVSAAPSRAATVASRHDSVYTTAAGRGGPPSVAGSALVGPAQMNPIGEGMPSLTSFQSYASNDALMPSPSGPAPSESSQQPRRW